MTRKVQHELNTSVAGLAGSAAQAKDGFLFHLLMILSRFLFESKSRSSLTGKKHNEEPKDRWFQSQSFSSSFFFVK